MKRNLLIAAFALTLLLGSLIFGVWETKQAMVSAKNINLPVAARHAKRAIPITTTLVGITFGHQPDIALWHHSLQALIEVDSLTETAIHYSQKALVQDADNEAVIVSLKTKLKLFSQRLQIIESKLNRSWFVKELVQESDMAKISLAQHSITMAEKLLSGKHRYLVLFQNSQEIRASGGFMGTYALVTLDDGYVKELIFQDIYEPDGQFNGFLEPPAGVREYLSSGKGWRLPDANWDADFAISSQKILSFFALVNQTDIEGVIAINSSVAEELLHITGPIEMSDYDTTVTPQNFATLARADRADFFPGSQQKENFLSTFFYKLLFTLQNLNSNEQQKVGELVIHQSKIKNILFFSQIPELQSSFQKLGITGAIDPPIETDFYLFSVESNVGINKANKGIDRSVKIELEESEDTIGIRFVNRNYPPTTPVTGDEADHLGYVNYHRLLLLSDTVIASITVDGKPVENWDEELVTTSTGKIVKQIGFLVTVPEQQQVDVVIKTTHPPLPEKPSIYIQKQPGLPTTTYQLSHNLEKKNIDLATDVQLLLSN